MTISSLVLLGVVDGLNICSLSLIALFISLLFTAKAARGRILLFGSVYIASVFLSYFASGLGILLFSLSLPAVPHLLARVSIGIMLFVGAVNMLNHLYPGIAPTSLSSALARSATRYMIRLSLPSTAAAGLLIGVHNFPCACTGGIYPAFISLVADSPFRLPYLALYNVMFILPLTVILYVCSSKAFTLRFRKWHQENAGRTRFGLGLIMVLISTALLVLLVFIGDPEMIIAQGYV